MESLVKTIETNLVELAKCNNKIRLNDSKITDTLAKMDSPSHKLNIDECFGPIQPLYKQLLNAFVEENSIVDTIFYLNEALQKGVITLDVFIKVCIMFIFTVIILFQIINIYFLYENSIVVNFPVVNS